MMASVSTPEPSNTRSSDRIPVFFGIRFMNQGIIQLIRIVGGSKGENFILEKKKDTLGKLV